MKKPYQTKEEYAEKAKARHRDIKLFEDEARRKMGFIEKKPLSLKQQKNRENKKYQDLIIKNWKQTGFFIEPDKVEIKKEIIKDELYEDDEVIDDVELEDCIEKEEEDLD